MSTNHRIRVLIGLTVMGSVGWATVRDHADADEPPAAATGSTAAATQGAAEQYLLFSDGRVIKGVITENGTEYLVGRPIGTMPFPKNRVEGVFATLHDAYAYRVTQLPERDSDERMKLARWCLELHMKAEAREQLTKILERDTENPLAKSMLFSMEQQAALLAQRERDPDVKQTAATAETMNQSRPNVLDSAVIQGAQRGLNVAGMPVIFDLPTPLAIKRTNEFFRYVHPLLQHYCVKCHDGNYDGKFQLVPIKSRTDRSPEALRANLDATLQLIDQENPSKSELLTSTLRAHGRGARPRPIFPGSNDLTYQILVTWAQSLRSPKAVAEAARRQPERSEAENSESFAVGRPRIGNASPEQVLSALANSAGQRSPALAGAAPGVGIPPPARFAPGASAGPGGQGQAAPDEFPLPFVLTGKMPSIPPPHTVRGPAAKPSARKGASASSAKPADAAGAPNPKSAGADDDDDADEAAEEPVTPKKPKKPVTIDPKLLERALQNRIAPR